MPARSFSVMPSNAIDAQLNFLRGNSVISLSIALALASLYYLASRQMHSLA
jgi:hypothetical protein